MKKFRATSTYSAPLAQVLAAQTSQDFVDHLADQFRDRIGGEVRDATTSTSEGTTTVTVRVYVPGTSIPAVARRFLSEGIEATVVETFSPARPDGTVPGAFTVTTNPNKAAITSTFTMVDEGATSRRDYDGELTLTVGFLSGIAEGQAIGRVDTITEWERRAVESYLASRA